MFHRRTRSSGLKCATWRGRVQRWRCTVTVIFAKANLTACFGCTGKRNSPAGPWKLNASGYGRAWGFCAVTGSTRDSGLRHGTASIARRSAQSGRRAFRCCRTGLPEFRFVAAAWSGFPSNFGSRWTNRKGYGQSAYTATPPMIPKLIDFGSSCVNILPNLPRWTGCWPSFRARTLVRSNGFMKFLRCGESAYAEQGDGGTANPIEIMGIECSAPHGLRWNRDNPNRFPNLHGLDVPVWNFVSGVLRTAPPNDRGQS